MAVGQFIPKTAVLQASPIVDPDTGMATVMLTTMIDAIINRVGGNSNPALTNYTTPLTPGSATGISGNAPSLTVGAATTAGTATTATTAATATLAGTANAATNLIGTPQLQAIAWSAIQTFSVPIVTTAFTVATLPVGTPGMRSYVSDANGPTFGSAVVGGGAVGTPVYKDTVSWKVG